MAQTGPIPAAVELSQLTDLRDTRLPTAWALSTSNSATVRLGPFQSDSQGGLDLPGTGPVIAIWPSDVSAIGQTIGRALEAQRRVYAIVESAEAEQVCAPFSAAGATSLLIRRVRSVPAGMVVTSGAGAVWVGTPTRRRWRLDLTQAQADSALRAALRLWWEDTEDEGWSEGQGFVWRPPMRAPFDVPRIRDDALIRFDGAPSAMPARDGDWQWTNEFAIPPQSLERLFLQPSGQRHDELHAAVDRGTSIEWADLDLPEIVLSEDSRCRSSSEHLHLDIRLEESQAQGLRESIPPATTARFVTNLALRDVAADEQILLPDSGAPASPIDREEIPCGDVPAATIDELGEVIPPSWPEASPLAMEANYTWQVVAPQLPKSAKVDPLVIQWEQADERYAAQIRQLSQSVNDLNKRVTQLPESARFGVAPAVEDLGARVGSLSAGAPSTLGKSEGLEAVGAAGAADVSLSEVSEMVGRAEQEIAAERAREERRSKYEEARKNAEAELPSRREEFEKDRQALAEVERQNAESAGQTKADKKKIRQERKRLQGRIEKLEDTIEKLEQQLEPLNDTPRPAAGTALGTPKDLLPPPPKAAPTLPSERLPTAGRLMRHGERRLLAIRTWEELKLTRGDAERLKAAVVLDAKETQ